MASQHRTRRTVVAALSIIIMAAYVLTSDSFQQPSYHTDPAPRSVAIKNVSGQAVDILATLDVKGRAPKTGYTRDAFGGKWIAIDGTCDARNVILHRDLRDITMNEKCHIMSGVLDDPYTGTTIPFRRGARTSSEVQIDHVVAISNAWQTGAQQLSDTQRRALYVDPLELLAVEGKANNTKSDGDAATWLPPNKAFRCQYVARQIAVKKKYSLWVTPPEKQAMIGVLMNCPGQTVPAGALGTDKTIAK